MKKNEYENFNISYDQHIATYDNLGIEDFCDEIINRFEDLVNIKSDKIGSYGDYLHVPMVIDKLHVEDRRSSLEILDHSNEFQEEFIGLISTCLSDYKRKYGLTNVRPDDIIIEGANVQRTNPSEGYHIWHSEQQPNDSSRFAVYTVYLNDVEEGGETEFLYQSKRVIPKKGRVSIFPASYTHTHRGNPPLKGSKYIITGWFLFKSLEDNTVNV